MLLQELIKNTENFLKLAEDMYKSGRLTSEEYDEMTFIKRNFVDQARCHTLGTKLMQRYKQKK
ncbi:hypothetical protein [Cellulosilyticum sp. I15G10I2]|uniref:hypothetical protein n=1 Tax=Cellulosilyticum sp. I15G10I2 TaxID=1892843 RepID=UPI00085C5525|nr:hypothetical protein [Cellulosilyticum sp. I15G10I2]